MDTLGQGPTSTREPVAPGDRIYRATRWLAAFIIPFLVVAFGILYFFPADTARLWAWTIRPPMTPMLMGAGYIGGAYFFLRAITAPGWHEITVGFLPVTTFASSMGIATALHWDRFDHGHPAFWVWLALYVTTPFLVLGTWLRNRPTDPQRLAGGDFAIPTGARLLLGILGAAVLGIGVLVFLRPDLGIATWPWPLTPLTSRVMGGWFALPGVFGLTIALDGRWGAARIALQSQAFSLALILVAVARDWSDFDPTRVTTYLFVGGMATLFVGIVVLYAALDRRRTAGL